VRINLLIRMLARATTLAVLAMWAFAPSAKAGLDVYEGFAYPDGTSIVGQTGGGGWSNAWNKNGNAGSSENATTPGLTYPGLPASGNKVTLAGQQLTTVNSTGSSAFVFRNFGAANSYGTDSSTAWISFIGQRTGAKSGAHGTGGTATYQRIFGISFFSGGTANTNERFNVGELSSSTNFIDTDKWALNVFDPANAANNLTVPSTTDIDMQSFLLVRINYGVGPGADNAFLWVNPDLSLGEPSTVNAQATLANKSLEFDRLRVSAGGSQSSSTTASGDILAASGLIDEIRVGTSFASVIAPGLIPGDVNGDLLVNTSDYQIIRNNFQISPATRAQGDLNADGTVNFTDFRIWKNNKAPGSGAELGLLDFAAPEPSSALLVLFAVVGFCGNRFGRSRRALR
jgi:hypothetical protein